MSNALLLCMLFVNLVVFNTVVAVIVGSVMSSLTDPAAEMHKRRERMAEITQLVITKLKKVKNHKVLVATSEHTITAADFDMALQDIDFRRPLEKLGLSSIESERFFFDM